MIKRFLSTLFITVIAVITFPCCKPDTEFPLHKNSYNSGFISGDAGIKYICQTNDINMSEYSHLDLRQGFVIKRAVERLVGGDVIGHVIAIYSATNQGFEIESMNAVQGGFLFAPIRSSQDALEYTRFMRFEPPPSGYSREHIDIDSKQDFDAALSGWTDNYKIIQKPPTDITRVTQQSDGTYFVELVFRCFLGKQRIEYMSCLVGSDGRLEPGEHYTYIEGPWGAML